VITLRSFVRTAACIFLTILSSFPLAYAQSDPQFEDSGRATAGEPSGGIQNTLADGLYMSGRWVASYGVNYSSVSVTLDYIYNNSAYTTGTLRLAYWATTSYPARGEGFTGYRLATFSNFNPLPPYYYYSSIARSSSMLLPPYGTYWLILVLEEYDPANCSAASGFCLVDSIISDNQRTFGIQSADLSVTQTRSPSGFAPFGKDLIFTITVTNSGPSPASGVTLSSTFPTGTDYVWASPDCTRTGFTMSCSLGTMVAGGVRELKLVVRPNAHAGGSTHRVEVSSAGSDPSSINNVNYTSIDFSDSPPGTPIFRYRLYSDVTKEHHFTTDINEYNILGSYVGTWVQEGTVGRVLNNPGSFNAVTAIPYYRLYNTIAQQHHWTTDPNEYYTLVQYPTWNGEGVDGYILPISTAGAKQLYRLLYPYISGLHHWTVDANEYNTLISIYGWVGEGGSGFVVQ
jgi:uncharacterized repeat protein (TIGR01451 family)